MPKKLAQRIEIDFRNFTLSIDGEVFPYRLSEDPVMGKVDGVPAVTITIPADTIIRHFPDNIGW